MWARAAVGRSHTELAAVEVLVDADLERTRDRREADVRHKVIATPIVINADHSKPRDIGNDATR